MTVTDIATGMLLAYPRDFRVDREVLVRCIDACADCAQACTQCADDCLSESGALADLAKCIRLNMDCADVCAVTERIISRQTEYDATVTRAMLDSCIAVCRACGDECGRHAPHMDHCRICADSCRACEEACRQLVTAMR